MPVRVIFRCEVCDARPDPETQLFLEHQLQELLFAQYVDIEPGNWLVWHGGFIYGCTRYACGDHRGELKASLRSAYGTVGPAVWKMGPHPVRFYRRGQVKARLRIGSGWGGPRWMPPPMSPAEEEQRGLTHGSPQSHRIAESHGSPQPHRSPEAHPSSESHPSHPH